MVGAQTWITMILNGLPWKQAVIILSFLIFLHLCVGVLVVQSCPTFCSSTDYSPPGFSVHGILQPGILGLPNPRIHDILQARLLEWIAVPFSRGSSQPRDQTLVSCIAGRFFTIWAVIFEIAPKYCTLDCFFDYEGYYISSKGFLPTVVYTAIIWIKFAHSGPF